MSGRRPPRSPRPAARAACRAAVRAADARDRCGRALGGRAISSRTRGRPTRSCANAGRRGCRPARRAAAASVARGLEPAAVLTELRRDPAVAEELVELLLGRGGEDLVRLGVLHAVPRWRAARDRLLPHRDVVSLRAREVLQQVPVALRRHDAEVEGRPSWETTVAFVPPWATTSATQGCATKWAVSAAGSSAVAMMSRSRTVSRRRRTLPASET